MKKWKRAVAAALAVMMAVCMLAVLGGRQQSKADGDKTRIGMMIFDWTSQPAADILEYCQTVLAPEFNIEFTTYTCGFDNNSVISTVENMITAGEDGLILMVSSGILEVDKICAEAGVPYALVTGKPTIAEEEILENSASDEFVLCFHAETDPSVAGAHVAQVMLDEGYTNCAVITTPPGMIEAGDLEATGFMTAFTDGGGTIVDTKFEIPGPAMITAADTVMATHGDEIDFMYGLLDIIQSIVTDPKYADKGVKIVSNELPSDRGVAMFESGTLAFCHVKIPQQVAFAVAAILNYLNGDSYPDAPQYKSVEEPYTDVYNYDDLMKFLDITNGWNGCEPAWTIDEIKSLIIAENPDATFADLVNLAQSCQIDDICERHGYER